MVLSESNVSGWPNLATEHAGLAVGDVAVFIMVEGTKDLEQLRLVDEALCVGYQHGRASSWNSFRVDGQLQRVRLFARWS